MPPLFKLKYDLYLTNERKLHCEISTNNRCPHCLKVDATGHFLLCTKSKIQKIFFQLIDFCFNIDKKLTAEKIIHMDIEGEKGKIYAIGWCLATITDYYYNNEKNGKTNDDKKLKLLLTHNYTTFNIIPNQQYNSTLELLKTLIEA